MASQRPGAGRATLWILALALVPAGLAALSSSQPKPAAGVPAPTPPTTAATPPRQPVRAAAGPVTATSPICGPVAGESRKDTDNVLAFCKAGIPEGFVSGAFATQSLLWIKVPRHVADAMVADRLTTENIVKTWMLGWRKTSGHQGVTIYVEWEKVEIAKGESTVFSGDVVSITRP